MRRRQRISFFLWTLFLFIFPHSQNLWGEIGTFYGIFHYQKKGLINVENLNISFIRIGICWGDIQPQKDKFLYDASVLKKIRECIKRGIKIIPVIRTAKAYWILKYPDKEASSPPRDLEENYNEAYGYSKSYYEFVKKLVTLFKDDFPIVVIENEVSGKKFWRGTAEEYIRLFITAKKAIKDVNPGIKVADSGLASFSWGLLMVDELMRKDEDEAFKFYKKYFRDAYFSHPHSFREWKEFMKKPRIRKYIKDTSYLIEKLKEEVDIFNFHYYEAPELFPALINFIKKKVGGKPLMCNELGVRYPSGIPLREEKASFDLIKKCVIAKTSRLKAIIIFPYYNNHHNIVGLGDKTSPNKVFYAFKTIMRLMNYPFDIYRNLSTQKLERHLFIFSNFSVEVIWSREGNAAFIRKEKNSQFYDYQGREIKKEEVVIKEEPIFVVRGRAKNWVFFFIFDAIKFCLC